MMVRLRRIALLAVILAAWPVWAQESTEPPPPVKAPIGTVTEESLPRAGGIMVFGGTGPLGLEIVKHLVERHESVTVLVRPTSDTAALKALGVNLVTGDALDPASLKVAFTSAAFRAAISTLGGHGGDYRVDIEGNKNVIDATKAAGVPRMILVTAIGAGESAVAAPWYIRWFMQKYMAAKSIAEEYLRASDLDYTIVRPGLLLNSTKPGQAALVADINAFSGITRSDLGRLIADSVEDKTTFKKALTAFDASRDSIWSLLF